MDADRKRVKLVIEMDMLEGDFSHFTHNEEDALKTFRRWITENMNGALHWFFKADGSTVHHVRAYNLENPPHSLEVQSNGNSLRYVTINGVHYPLIFPTKLRGMEANFIVIDDPIASNRTITKKPKQREPSDLPPQPVRITIDVLESPDAPEPLANVGWQTWMDALGEEILDHSKGEIITAVRVDGVVTAVKPE